MITEYKAKKKKKVKKNNYIDEDNQNDEEQNSQNESEEKKTTKKKRTKKKKAGTEVKSTKKNKLENIDNISDQEQELTLKPKKKKKKKKKIIEEEETKEENLIDNEYNDLDNEDNNKIEENNSENEEETKPKKKKKKKKKTIKEEETKEENLTDIENENNNKMKENNLENEEIKPKKKKKKKKKTKTMSIDEDNKDNNEDDIDNFRPKTSKPKKTKKLNDIINNNDYDNRNIKKQKKKNNIDNNDNLDNNYNEDNNDNNINNINEDNKSLEDEKINKKKDSKNKNKFLNIKNYRKVVLEKLGKKINLNNTKQMNLTKSFILNSFSTKLTTKKETDYEEEKNQDDNNTLNTIKEEGNEKDDLKGSFADLLIKINDLDYQGYNYKIKQEDYFKRKPNEQPISTILNSEDAAIKKCEELMESLGDLKWIDPDFGPQPNDNGKGSKKSIFGDVGSASSLKLRPEYIEWYTINEINENATFFYDGTESNDVMQGILGDCWFISALSVIATKDYLLRGEFDKGILDDGKIDEEEIKMMSEGIYPPIFHSFSSKGIYCFRFFKNFKWRYVLIDDRLPCNAVYNPNQTKKLLFAHCRQDNEFWVPLIEKAYAKLHGSYCAIESGCIDDGLVDMTGLVSKKILKDNILLTMPTKIDELWKILKEYSSIKFDNELKTQSGKKVTSKYYTRNKSMMGCSVEPNSKMKEQQVSMQGHNIGIIAGHAYSILDAFEIPKARSKKSRKTSRLLRIKNPWGKYEWNGKWCDNSEEVIKNKERIENALKKKYEDTSEKINLSQEDGTFLMRFSDFRKIFNNIFFCQNFPPNFIGVRFHDEWTKENSGGLPFNNTKQEFIDFFRNPQYYIQLKKSGKMIINLLQNDGRLFGAKFPFEEYIKRVCLIIFKTKSEMPLDIFDGRIDQTYITRRRDLSMELNLDKGQYIVIPSLATKGECTTFNMEFYFEDELISNTKNNFNFNQLKNTYIKRLGKEVKCELINEYIASEMKMASKNKLDFIISAFQYSIKNGENENKIKNNNGFNFNGGYDDEEDF